MEFSVDKFIQSGSFFDNDQQIGADWLKERCDGVFGGKVLMYYFYQENFTVSFVYDTLSDQVMAAQLEMPNQTSLEGWTKYEDFVKKYDSEIIAIYGDEAETVLFMQSSVNVYFNKKADDNVLTKITSGSDASRNLAINILARIR